MLEEHKIGVVVSALPSSFDAQVSLIRACAKAKCVGRFAPSEWLIDFEKDDPYVFLFPSPSLLPPPSSPLSPITTS